MIMHLHQHCSTLLYHRAKKDSKNLQRQSFFPIFYPNRSASSMQQHLHRRHPHHQNTISLPSTTCRSSTRVGASHVQGLHWHNMCILHTCREGKPAVLFGILRHERYRKRSRRKPRIDSLLQFLPACVWRFGTDRNPCTVFNPHQPKKCVRNQVPEVRKKTNSNVVGRCICAERVGIEREREANDLHRSACTCTGFWISGSIGPPAITRTVRRLMKNSGDNDGSRGRKNANFGIRVDWCETCWPEIVTGRKFVQLL